MTTRKQFIQAVQTGITAAGPALTERQRDALRQVAVSAKCVTDLFDGCPLTLAGLYNSGSEGDYICPVWAFVDAYDAQSHHFDWSVVEVRDRLFFVAVID